MRGTRNIGGAVEFVICDDYRNLDNTATELP